MPLAFLLASGCATDPLAPAGGLEPWEKVEFKATYTVKLSPRARASLRPAGASPEREGYVQLGSIEVALSEERCFPSSGQPECGTKAHDASPSERLAREAAHVGADLVVLSTDNTRTSRPTSRNGRCLATMQVMQPYQRCSYETTCRNGICFQRTTGCTTQYTPVSVCSNYEKVWGTERVARSAGAVYRKDPDFALQIKHGDDFAAALLAGDLKRVTRLAREGMRLDIQDLRGRQPLLLAVESGSVETVSFAMANGADPNIELGESMLVAIRRQNAGILRALLERGGNPNAGLGFWKLLFATPDAGVSKAQGRLLQAAVETGNLELARLLLDKGADPRQPDDTPLKTAISMRNLPVIELLITRGANIDSSGGLVAAAHAKDLALVELLLSKGADVNATGSGGQTALFQAAFTGDADMARLLIRRGADVDKRGIGQVWNPIIAAVIGGYEEVVALLIAAKSDLSQTDGMRGFGWLARLGGYKESTVLQKALSSLKAAKAPADIARRQRIVDRLRAAGAAE
jgi:ankyrin repeat protein